MPRPRLETLVACGHTALLLQEVQQGIIGDASPLAELADSVRRSGALARISAITAAARRVGVPVVHCTAENLPGDFGANRNARLFHAARRAGAEHQTGTAAALPMPEVGVVAGDIVLPRYHGLSPMTGSPLDSLLRNEGVTTLVVAGVSLNVAIPNLVFDGVNRSYQVVVVTDAVAGVPQEYGAQVIEHSLGLVATLVTAAELVSIWR